ncbi:MAG TPA: class I SAM-dependent methyltransferase [Myxococcaceae bacterium]|nr:class I SAM-dependent methyltransferase [Myxococcaceae bacterium]
MPLILAEAAPAPRWTEGPLFDTVDRVLADRDEYRWFRRGLLSAGEWHRLLDGSERALVAAGVPAEDVQFAKRYPSSIQQFADGVLADLEARGVIATGRYDAERLASVEKAAQRYRHDGRRTYIYPEEARVLFALADILRPRRALFLGSFYGYWAHWALPSLVAGGGRAVLVDPDERAQRVARANLPAAYRGKVDLVVSTGERFLDEAEGPFDFVVLDAEGPRDHPDPEQRGKRVYRPLLEHALPRLAPGALLVCHNILLSDRTGAPFFSRIIQRNQGELGAFMALVERTFDGFTEHLSTEGIGIGRFRGPGEGGHR